MAAVAASTSTSTGTAPVAHTADAVGTAVNAGTITSSPGPMPSAASDELQAPTRRWRRRRPRSRRRRSVGGQLGFEGRQLGAEQHGARVEDARRWPRRTSSWKRRCRRLRSTTGTTSDRRSGATVAAMPSAKEMRGRPAEHPLGLGEVALEAADVDAQQLVRATARSARTAGRPAARCVGRAISVERQRVVVAEVEDLAGGVGGRAPTAAARRRRRRRSRQSRRCVPSP